MTPAEYQPLFPYFGGKSAVADVIWDALGDVVNYVEPFLGTGAVLFLRPHPHRIATVNDADGMVSNFWRALRAAADEVAEYADWPVNEVDLHARHLWLLGQRERITERLMGDPDFFDAKAAGWWVWGICQWIGGGWCDGSGPWVSEDGVLVKREDEPGVSRRLPHLGSAGMGIHHKLPSLGNAGMGIHRKLPSLGDAGRGVNRQLPAGRGRLEWLRETMHRFADVLREVRVACGDWSRVCGESVTFKHGLTGVFLDPPYSAEANRDMKVYAVDSGTVAHEVREWALANGDNKLMRIVLAGYAGEHAMPADWRCHEWKARGGYGNQGDGQGRENKHRERLYFSPHCLNPQPTMFE